jgi:hypothetical protein
MSGNGVQEGPDAVKSKPRSSLPKISGYEIQERIGRGGMGEVYVARQLALMRLVAIKFLLAEGDFDQENELARFHREAKLMAKVSHPNVLSIFDFGEVDGRPYLVMEYVEGGDLRQRMSADRPMPPDEVLEIILPVGSALEYLHRNGIIHRDLKPENILLHDGRNPRVTDFGIAVLRTGAGTAARTGQGMGTVGYVAPEQHYRLKVDERADQFSLAALAYEMLTGQLPLGIFKPPSHLNPALGPELDTVIIRALQDDPKARYATIDEFIEALKQSLRKTTKPPGMLTSRRLVVAALSLVAVFTAAGLARWWQTPAIRLQALLADPGLRPADPASALELRNVLKAAGAAADPKDQNVVEGAAEAAPAKLCPLEEELKRLRAKQLWEDRGSPTGLIGEAIKDENWSQAVAEIEAKLKAIAFEIWNERGGPKGVQGKAMEAENWRQAKRRLYKRMTGSDPPEFLDAQVRPPDSDRAPGSPVLANQPKSS